MALYPNGYGRQMITLQEMQNKHGGAMHPEYARRLFHWIEQQGGAIGIGSSWRSTPNAVSAASRAGKSFHQDQRFASGFGGCSAVDLVHTNGDAIHRAPDWSEVPEQGSEASRLWGLHCNVSGEPWHIQCIEQDGWESWDAAGRPDPDPRFVLPDGTTGTEPSVPDNGPRHTDDAFMPEQGVYGLFPLDREKPTIQLDSAGDLVEYLQAVMRNQTRLQLNIDGHFGPRTELCVRKVQGWNAVPVNGICDSGTWRTIDTYATR